MSQRLCRAGCLYEVDGRCRLEHRLGERVPVCPHYERNLHSYQQERTEV
ncbi:MAG: cleavage protein [Desulfitobacteriaceae bacterium]